MKELEIPDSKDLKIAIIGAGIAGLTAAHTLKQAGYKNIIIYEGRDRVGGKVNTREIDGYLYELGAIFSYRTDKTILNMAKEYNVSLNKDARYALFFDKGKQFSASQYMRSKYSLMEILRSYYNLIRLLLKHKNPDAIGFANIAPALTKNLKDFSKTSGIEPIAHILGLSAGSFGYGYIDEVPAMYHFKMLKDSKRFAITSELNQLFGLKLTTMLTYNHGFQSLLEMIAKDFDVRLNSKVTGISRNRQGDTFSLSVTAEDKTDIFDRVVISSIPVQTMMFLDASEQETTLFSKVKYYNFHVTLFYGEGLPKSSNGLMLDHNHLANPKGFPGTITNLNPEHNIFTAYQLGNGELTAQEREQKLLETVSNLGGRVKDIILIETYEYFPHFAEHDYGDDQPFRRLEEMQGEKGTYYIGGLFNFESTEGTAQHAKSIVNRFF